MNHAPNRTIAEDEELVGEQVIILDANGNPFTTGVAVAYVNRPAFLVEQGEPGRLRMIAAADHVVADTRTTPVPNHILRALAQKYDDDPVILRLFNERDQEYRP